MAKFIEVTPRHYPMVEKQRSRFVNVAHIKTVADYHGQCSLFMTEGHVIECEETLETIMHRIWEKDK